MSKGKESNVKTMGNILEDLVENLNWRIALDRTKESIKELPEEEERPDPEDIREFEEKLERERQQIIEDMEALKRDMESRGLLKELISTRKAVQKYREEEYYEWLGIDIDYYQFVVEEGQKLIQELETIFFDKSIVYSILRENGIDLCAD